LRLEAKRTGKTVEELLESTADARTSDQRQQALIVALRRSTSIEALLPPVTEPVVPVSTDDDPSIGSATAPVTIIEFSDFQCPYCRESVSVLKEVLREYGNKVRLVYRDYPAPQSCPCRTSGGGAECAAAQNKFWEYHDPLFEQQYPGSGWDFELLARQASLDVTVFSRCLNAHDFAAEVNGDLQDALKLGVSSTPTFFINGRPLVGGRSFEEFKFLIDKALTETN
jgi:protein-disulfide isomerase